MQIRPVDHLVKSGSIGSWKAIQNFIVETVCCSLLFWKGLRNNGVPQIRRIRQGGEKRRGHSGNGICLAPKREVLEDSQNGSKPSVCVKIEIIGNGRICFLLFADILMKTEAPWLLLVSFDQLCLSDITNRFNNRTIRRRQRSVTQIRLDSMRD
jgi:hypothetical protein